jgi:hypothetical protein
MSRKRSSDKALVRYDIHPMLEHQCTILCTATRNQSCSSHNGAWQLCCVAGVLVGCLSCGQVDRQANDSVELFICGQVDEQLNRIVDLPVHLATAQTAHQHFTTAPHPPTHVCYTAPGQLPAPYRSVFDLGLARPFTEWHVWLTFVAG